MKFFEDVELQEIPFRFSYRRLTQADYKGFYHCHQGMEFVYVYQGSGQIVVNRKVYPLQPGAFIYLQPYQLHHVQVEVNPDAPFERTIITLEPTSFEAYFDPFPHLKDCFRHLWKNEMEEQGLQHVDRTSYLYDLFQFHYLVAAQSQPQANQHNFALLLMQIVQFLHLNGFGKPKDTGLNPQRPIRYSEKIMNWLEGHYSEEITLDRLAEHTHISKYYVSRIFKQETGVNLTEYILARRIRQACLLLNTGDKGIEQISIEVGMHNFPYFCQAFKKLVGLSPMQYRKKLLCLPEPGRT